MSTVLTQDIHDSGVMLLSGVTRSQPAPKVSASLVCHRLERPESGPGATDAESE